MTTGKSLEPSQFATDTQMSPTHIVMDVTLNKIIDVTYDTAITHRRRRLEWPTSNETCIQDPESYSSNVSQKAKELADNVIDEEFSRCGESSFHEDQSCMDELIGVPIAKHRSRDTGALLHALYYRGRQQSAIWDMWCALLDKGLVSIDGLRYSINFREHTDPVRLLSWLLSCFELPLLEANTRFSAQSGPYKLHCWEYSQPIRWLATMIIRRCADVQKVFDTIRATNFLGPLNLDALQQYMDGAHPKNFTVNTRERSGPMTREVPFGFWLPHGLEGKTMSEALGTVYKKNVMRFNRIEMAFKEYFKHSDETVLLEKEQRDFLEQMRGMQISVSPRIKTGHLALLVKVAEVHQVYAQRYGYSSDDVDSRKGGSGE
ncbi:hypothetical protein ACLMJK_002843 [Lecanora helva]